MALSKPCYRVRRDRSDVGPSMTITSIVIEYLRKQNKAKRILY